MRVLIVTPCGLPIPAVKGGAVLTLMESLIIQNENKNILDLSVVGIYDKDAVIKSKEYKNTNFIFLNKPKMFTAIDSLYELFCEKILKKTHKIKKRYVVKTYLLFRLKKLLKAENYDSIVFQNAGYLLRVLKNKQISDKYKGKLYYHLHNDVPKNVYIEGLKQCRLILISEYLKKSVQLLCKNSFNGSISILKNGIDCSSYHKILDKDEQEIIRNNLGISNDKKIVLFVGRIDPTKGIEHLVDAFKLLDREDTVLLVVGSHNFGDKQTSPFEQKMKVLFESLGSKIVFTGYVKYDEIWKYYKIASVAVLPSMWEEPAGLTMIETIAAGTPLITTVSGGIPEYISDDWAILLKKDENLIKNISASISDVIDNEEKWKNKAKKGQEYVWNNFSEEKYYDNFVNIIMEEGTNDAN